MERVAEVPILPLTGAEYLESLRDSRDVNLFMKDYRDS